MKLRLAVGFSLSATLLILLAAPPTANTADPVRVIFDTDMGNDIDDALALAMLHAFETRGEVKVLAVTVTKDNRWAAAYINLVNTFYGRPDIPVGVVKDGKTPEDSAMIRGPAEMKRNDGTPVYPHHLVDGSQAPEATGLLRRILSAEKDSAVTIVQVGFSTNLARLLASGPDRISPRSGRELVGRKVRLLTIMAGNFDDGKPEFNVKTDLPAAQKLFSDWPTPIIVSGFEIGDSILYPARSIEDDFRYVEHHPIADAYRAYMKMPYDRPTWDLTAVLQAVRPDRGYFSLSAPGRITVSPDGNTIFASSNEGKHRYLMVDGRQRTRILEAFLYLVTQPPVK
ncbi:MAG TPA: nucleoside hydrolase [Acidobacteriota bacterium]|jgi:inosine-uridine nucleoside N-ribohydrolase